MQITANGKDAEVRDGSSVTEMLNELKVQTPEYVSVELNGEIISRQVHDTTTVSEGDVVEFLYFMGGGAF